MLSQVSQKACEFIACEVEVVLLVERSFYMKGLHMFGTNTLLQCLSIATVARQNAEGAMAKVREDLKARKGRQELSNDSLRHGLRLGRMSRFLSSDGKSEQTH